MKNDATNELELLSALVDAERVDPDGVERALARPGAAAFLADCLRLREALREDRRPSPAFAREARRHLGGHARPRRWLAAAGLAAVLAAAALWMTRPERPTPSTMPEPDRVFRLVPGRDWTG